MQTEPDRQIQDHPHHRRRHRGKRGGEKTVVAQLLDVRCSQKNPKKARLRKVEADLALDKNGWVNADAANGVVDMRAGSLELSGGINVFSDAGYALHSQSASLDLNKWIVHGHNEVTGQGPLGTIRADQFHYDRDNHQLTLDGHVRMTLIGNRK